MKQVYLKKGKEDSINRFHPWIFSGAIHHFSLQPEEGEVVEVYASTPIENGNGWDFKYVATGHFQIGSIMVRILSFEKEDINESFYYNRIESAYNMR
jgi:23S rRNA (cytosine1962-C5)-methyltransferase